MRSMSSIASTAAAGRSCCRRCNKRFREYIGAPVLAHVKADFGGFQAYDTEPAAIPDLLAERPVVLLGKWKGDASGTVTIRGTSGTGEYVQSFDLAQATTIESTQAL